MSRRKIINGSASESTTTTEVNLLRWTFLLKTCVWHIENLSENFSNRLAVLAVNEMRKSAIRLAHFLTSLLACILIAAPHSTQIHTYRRWECTKQTTHNRIENTLPTRHYHRLFVTLQLLSFPHLHRDSTRKTKTLQRRMCTCWARRNVAHSAPRKGHHCHIAQAKLRSERTLFVNENTALNFVVSISFSCYFFYTWNCFLSFFIPF